MFFIGRRRGIFCCYDVDITAGCDVDVVIGNYIGSRDISILTTCQINAVEAGKDVSISASDVLAGKDINLTGQNVTIESADNTYNAQEKHEYKKSGLTVAIGGQALDKVNEAIGHIERAGQVEDDRLAALHAYKAYDTVKDNIGMIKDAVNDPAGNLSLNVSVGTQKSESHIESSTVLARQQC